MLVESTPRDKLNEERFVNVSETYSAATDLPEQHHDDGKHQENVDQTTQSGSGHQSEGPEYGEKESDFQ